MIDTIESIKSLRASLVVRVNEENVICCNNLYFLSLCISLSASMRIKSNVLMKDNLTWQKMEIATALLLLLRYYLYFFICVFVYLFLLMFLLIFFYLFLFIELFHRCYVPMCIVYLTNLREIWCA